MSEDFDQIYAAHADSVFRFCYRLVRDRSTAEDVAQEVFVAALQGMDKLRGEASIRTWLYRVALYQCRRVNRRASIVSLWRPAVPEEPDVAQQIDLERAITRLPQAMREAFVLVKAEGLTAEEAGEVLGCTVGTVKSQVFHAVRRVRAALTVAPEPNQKEQETHVI